MFWQCSGFFIFLFLFDPYERYECMVWYVLYHTVSYKHCSRNQESKWKTTQVCYIMLPMTLHTHKSQIILWMSKDTFTYRAKIDLSTKMTDIEKTVWDNTAIPCSLNCLENDVLTELLVAKSWKTFFSNKKTDPRKVKWTFNFQNREQNTLSSLPDAPKWTRVTWEWT